MSSSPFNCLVMKRKISWRRNTGMFKTRDVENLDCSEFNLKPGLLSWLCRKTDGDNEVNDSF